MGVRNLWELLYPYAQTESLPSKALREGFLKNSQHQRSLVLGIDVSIWFAQVENCKYTKRQNYQLELLYHRCAWLSEMAVKVLFVFDGPDRPMKKKRKPSSDEHYLIQSFCIMVHAFGFEFHTAPGEAEAELAMLEQLGIIDAIMTDDSDAFLFGARTVIRNRSAKVVKEYAKNINGKRDDEHVYTFRADEFIQKDGGLLTRGSFVLMGLLSGGDYSDGVHKIGIKTAVRIHQFGDSLLNAAQTSDKSEWENVLVEWRNNLITQLTNGTYSTTILNLAKALPKTFPDPCVLEYYCRPLVSNLNVQEFKTTLWKRKFDMGSIAHIGEYYFGWDGPTKLFPHLHKRICRAFLIQKLIESSILIDCNQFNQYSQANDILPFLIKISHTTRRISMDHFQEYRIIVQFQPVIPEIRIALTNHRQLQAEQVLLFLRGASSKLTDVNMAVFTQKIRIYLPAALLDLVVPRFVISQRPIKIICLKRTTTGEDSDNESEDLPSAHELI